MSDEQMIGMRTMTVELDDGMQLSQRIDMGWRQPHHAALPGWVAASQEERIACLECIIAILIEKNEQMRQQLRMRMD